MQVWSLGGEEPWRRKWQPTPIFLPGAFHGQRSLAGYSPWGCKEMDMTKTTKTTTLFWENLHSPFSSKHSLDCGLLKVKPLNVLDLALGAQKVTDKILEWRTQPMTEGTQAFTWSSSRFSVSSLMAFFHSSWARANRLNFFLLEVPCQECTLHGDIIVFTLQLFPQPGILSYLCFRTCDFNFTSPSPRLDIPWRQDLIVLPAEPDLGLCTQERLRWLLLRERMSYFGFDWSDLLASIRQFLIPSWLTVIYWRGFS